MANAKQQEGSSGAEAIYEHPSLKNILAITMADIDIYLLKEEDQKTDKDKVYTKEEIREQLKKSMRKALDAYSQIGVNIHKSLVPTGEEKLRAAGLSEWEIKRYKELAEEKTDE